MQSYQVFGRRIMLLVAVDQSVISKQIPVRTDPLMICIVYLDNMPKEARMSYISTQEKKNY